MGKLQLYMTMSRDDFAHKVDINAAEDVKQWVTDLSAAVRQVDYNPKRKHIFYMVKYIETGAFIVVIRTIPQKHGHHLASWIYVPYSLRISNAEVKRLVDFITGIVSNDAVGSHEIEAIRQEFGNDYPEDPLAPQFAPNEGQTYCYRYYGGNTGDTLSELIGPYRYQTSYLSYDGVLLVDAEISSNISGSNLTSAPKTTMVVLLPPIESVVEGYKPTIYGQRFDVPFFVPYQETIEVIWHKPGTADKRVPVCPSLSESRAPGLESASPSQAIESKPQAVEYQPAKPKEEPSAQPKQPAWEPQPVEEKKPKPQPAQRKPKRKNVYVFSLPTTHGDVEFTLQTDQMIEESPVEGYVVDGAVYEGDDQVNYLESKDKKQPLLALLKQKGLWVLGGLVVGFLLGLLCTCGHGSKGAPATNDSTVTDTTKVAANPVDTAIAQQPVAQPVQQQQPAQQAEQQPAQPAQQQQQPAQTQQPTGEVSAEAIAYLDGNKKWYKTELDKFPELAGLYDDLNAINHDRLIDYWGPRLSKSKTFTDRIVVHTKLAKSQKKNPVRKPYCTDGNITVQGWLNNVDPTVKK